MFLNEFYAMLANAASEAPYFITGRKHNKHAPLSHSIAASDFYITIRISDPD